MTQQSLVRQQQTLGACRKMPPANLLRLRVAMLLHLLLRCMTTWALQPLTACTRTHHMLRLGSAQMSILVLTLLTLSRTGGRPCHAHTSPALCLQFNLAYHRQVRYDVLSLQL